MWYLKQKDQLLINKVERKLRIDDDGKPSFLLGTDRWSNHNNTDNIETPTNLSKNKGQFGSFQIPLSIGTR